MNGKERTFQEFSDEEKLEFIENCMDHFHEIAGEEDSPVLFEWQRRHIPAYNCKDEKNYVFVSYSHRDYKAVYRDLAFFSYNTKKRVRFWYDEGLKPGEKWFEEAEKMLSNPNCVGVLFYLSENFLKSNSILREIEMVKKYKKPYFTTTLEKGKNCAEDYLTSEEDAPILEKVADVFPGAATSVPAKSVPDDISSDMLPETYSPIHEDVLYRIGKIEAAFGVVEEVYSDYTFEDVGDGLSLVEYKGDDGDIYIPERVDGKTVVEVRASFNTAHRIYIPRTVKRILPTILENFEYTNIKNHGLDDLVRITETLLDIERGIIPEKHDPQVIFGRADHLKFIEVSENNPYFYDKDGVLYIEDTLLRYPPKKPWDNKYLDGITYIGPGAVFNHHERERPSIPENPPTVPATVKEIGNHAFAYCTFWDIQIAEGVKKIGIGAFAGYSCLEVEPIGYCLPASIEEIGEYAFKGSNVPSIYIPSKLKTIPRGAFLAFTGEKIAFKHGVKDIGERAFAQCKNLKDLIIPSISGRIGEYAFSYCEQLKSMSVPATVTDICDNAFSYCKALSKLELQDGIKRIENCAFSNCRALRSVTLPNTIEYLAPSSFDDCESLICIFYNGSNYEELIENSGLLERVIEAYNNMDPIAAADEIINKLVLKNQWFERIRLKTILKIGDLFRKYQ